MSTKTHQCVNCQKVYQPNSVPNDLLCTETDCDLIGLLIEVDIPLNEVNPNNGTAPIYNPTPSGPTREAGLCVLLMDASGSMFYEPAFPGTSFKSKYGNEFLSRAEMITNVCASAIFDLANINLPDDSYICPILFDHTRSVLFTKSISDIISEYGSADNLAKFMFDKMNTMKGGTDISSALTMAHSFVDKFIEGSVPGMGNYIAMQQLVPTLSGGSKDVYNIRTLVYTDGEQLVDFGALTSSPFQSMDTDLLMGVFIGDEKENGYNQLRNIIDDCPVHGVKQFFAISSPTQMATLKGIFKSASGASGFCPQCQPTKPIPDHWK